MLLPCATQCSSSEALFLAGGKLISISAAPLATLPLLCELKRRCIAAVSTSEANQRKFAIEDATTRIKTNLATPGTTYR